MECLTYQDILILLEALDMLEITWGASTRPEKEQIEKLKKLLATLLTSLSPTLP